MKNLVNRDLTEYWEDDDLNSGSPRKISMRKQEDGKGRFNGGDKYWDHWDRELYISVDRFLKSCIGKNFDKSFHKFCQKYPKYVGKTNTRNLFREYFFDKYRGDYYVDSNNCIQFNKSNTNKQKISIDIPQYIMDEFIKVDLEYIKSNTILMQYLEWVFGKKNWNHVLNCGGRIDVGFYNNMIDTAREYSYEIRSRVKKVSNKKLEEIFQKTQIGIWDTIIKGTNDWKQYRAEETDARKKRLREYEKEKDLKYSTLLKEIEDRKKEKEKSLNIVTRDRMGFNDESFIGEPYHGRKGKTK